MIGTYTIWQPCINCGAASRAWPQDGNSSELINLLINWEFSFPKLSLDLKNYIFISCDLLPANEYFQNKQCFILIQLRNKIC